MYFRMCCYKILNKIYKNIQQAYRDIYKNGQFSLIKYVNCFSWRDILNKKINTLFKSVFNFFSYTYVKYKFLI